MEESPFYVDRAKGGRASCRGCRGACPSGELRMAKIGMGPHAAPMKFWHHVDCLMAAFMKQRPATKRIKTVADIGNFDSLTAQDKSFILDKLNAMEVQYAQKNNLDTVVVVKESETVDDKPPKKTDYDSDHMDNRFEQFCRICVDISNEDKYTMKTAVVRKLFSEGTDGGGFKSDVSLWCRLLLPRAVKRIYNLKSKQLVKLFSKIFHANSKDMIEDLEKGNVGETIMTFFQKSKTYASTASLTVFEIDLFLNQLSGLTKEEDQMNHFKTLVGRCTVEEIKYLIYLINGDLRINAGAKHVLEALHPDAHRVFESSRDIDFVISKVLDSKMTTASKQISSPVKRQVKAEVLLMKPVQPMLAEACKSVEMAMDKCKNGMLSEIKYDGERVQLHKRGNEFKYFSRSLKPVMDHKVARFREFIPKAFPHGNDMILDSEILMMDTKTGQPLPFGSLGIHKKNEFQNAEVCLIVFDCIFYNGESLINEPMSKRREILENNINEIKNHVMISEVKIIHKEDELRDMIAKVLKLGLEGLVLKDLQSIYEPGKRHWLKVKKDYLFDGAMADSADLVVLGAWFGTGKKGGMLSVFLMGCHDQTNKQWLTVTKVHTGHDDETLESLQQSLRENMIKISQDGKQLPSWIKCTKTMIPDFIAKDPKKQPVWEITGTEFTKAQIHTADGISIRFPRVTKIRDDKCWKTATNLEQLKTLFKTSKENTDVTLLQKRPSPINLDEDSSNVKAKKIKLSNMPSTSKQSYVSSGPLLPLPDIFDKCIIKFYTEGINEKEQKKIREYVRHIEAYGGKFDDNEDGCMVTHVIHFSNEVKSEEVLESNDKYNNSSRHVTIDWLTDSIHAKGLKNTVLYPVFLSNT